MIYCGNWSLSIQICSFFSVCISTFVRVTDLLWNAAGQQLIQWMVRPYINMMAFQNPNEIYWVRIFKIKNREISLGVEYNWRTVDWLGRLIWWYLNNFFSLVSCLHFLSHFRKNERQKCESGDLARLMCICWLLPSDFRGGRIAEEEVKFLL